MNRYLFCTLILVFLACCIALPASAVIQEVTLKGSVASLSASANTVAIENPLRYGCSYPASGSPVCTFTPMNTSALTGTAPDPAAFTMFKTGDPVVATSLGGAGETWIALAKLFGSRPDQEHVTDIAGDATTIPTPLAGNYSLVLDTNPDCTTCAGTICTAGSASVVIQSDGRVVANRTLLPGGVLTFNGRNDGSSVSVTFVKGQALPNTCPQHRAGIVGGVQPVSDYIVRVVPPIGMIASGAEIPLPVASAPPAAATTPAQTRKSTSLPVVVIGALGVAALVLAARRL
ncbi:hypothetical protein [Methanoregula sp.]|uniref:hypothetical protein n=1 Tax=Methanoregula sp. TaxID=2052170 RepID=UPI00356A9353